MKKDGEKKILIKKKGKKIPGKEKVKLMNNQKMKKDRKKMNNNSNNNNNNNNNRGMEKKFKKKKRKYAFKIQNAGVCNAGLIYICIGPGQEPDRSDGLAKLRPPRQSEIEYS